MVDKKDALIILFFGLVYSFILSNLFQSWVSLPSPIYGGDYYYQMGSIFHAFYSNNVDTSGSFTFDSFGSSSINEHIPTYSTLYALGVSVFAKLSSLSIFHAMLYINYLFVFLAIMICYFLFKEIFKDSRIAVVGLLLFLPITAFPLLKYTEFTWAAAIPFFLLMLYRAYKEDSFLNIFLLGLSYGGISLLHPTGLLIGAVTISVFGIHAFFKPIEANPDNKLEIRLRSYLFPFVLAGLIGFTIGLMWFAPVILGGIGAGQVNTWGFWDLTKTDIQINFIFSVISDYLINFGNLSSIIISVFFFIGIYSIHINRRNNDNATFITLLLCSALILTFHYLISVPLIGTFFAPNYMQFMILKIAIIVISLYGISYICSNRKTMETAAIFFVLILSIIISTGFTYSDWYNSKWFTIARNWSVPPSYEELQSYLIANTSTQDVILSSNELCFAVNALSGRKCLAFRRGHVSPFYDFDDREIAAALILYGNNQTLREEMLKRYSVDYVYIDTNWQSSEWVFNENGSVVNYYDPLIVFDTPEHRDILARNGVKTAIYTGWLDPSMQTNFHNKVDMLIITPDNYQANGDVWNPYLYKYLKIVWTSSDGNAALFRIDFNLY